jgi:PAS domain S-box-containing protein
VTIALQGRTGAPPRRRLCGVAAALWLSALAAIAAGAAPARATTAVLIIYADSRTLPAAASFDEIFRATLRANAPPEIEVLGEFLELGRYGADHYPAMAAEFLRNKYARSRFVAVIAGGPIALEFLAAHGARIFPDTPIVHAYVDRDWLARRPPAPDVIGVPAQFDIGRTIALMLRLHPGTRRIVYVTGTSGMDRHLLSIFERHARSFAGRVAFEVWADLPIAETLGRLAGLPADTLVLTSSVLRDGDGRWFTGRESVRLMSKVSSVPIYGFINPQIGAGLVGGYMPTIEDAATTTARLILRLAAGEKPATLALPEHLPSRYIFDWRELRRWNIADTALPEGSVIEHREPSLWERYRWQIIVGGVLGLVVLALCVAEGVLIARLVAERRLRRRTEEGLVESEARLNLAANAAHLALWHWDLAADSVWMSDRGRSILGLPADGALNSRHLLSVLHPNDRDGARVAMDNVVARGGELDHEARIVRPDGSVAWVGFRGRRETGPDGRATGFRGIAIDVSARREAQADAQRHRDQAAHLSRVTILGQLSGALAHELNQPLSAILSNAEAAQRFLAQDAVNLDELREILSDIVADDRRAGTIIERLREMLRRGAARRRPLDLNETVRGVEKLCHSDLVTRNVELNLLLTPSLPPVEGDLVQLQQVILNMIVNACDAMATNAVADRQVTLKTEREASGDVKISVSDRGHGIGEAEAARLFEPFVTSKASGLGLGLSISRSIVVAHGGRMWGGNNAGGPGATFAFSLPALAEGAPA